MPPYKWHFVFTDAALEQIKRLSSKDRAAVFASIAELLFEDNPLSGRNIGKVKQSQLWRKRQGNYRITFTLLSEPVIHDENSYKGTVTITRVMHRRDVYRS